MNIFPIIIIKIIDELRLFLKINHFYGRNAYAILGASIFYAVVVLKATLTKTENCLLSLVYELYKFHTKRHRGVLVGNNTQSRRGCAG